MGGLASMENGLQGIRAWLPTLTPARVRDDADLLSSVSALSAAALETRKIIARYRLDGVTHHRSNSRLMGLWQQASLALMRVDPELAARCLSKADYWADPATWTADRVQEAGIALDDVFDEALKLVSLAAATSTPEVPDIVPNRVFGEEDLDRVSVGIITALPKEFAAVKRVLGNGNEVTRAGTGSGRRYWIAQIPSSDGRVHIVALAQLVSMGNNVASGRTTQLLEHCRNASVVMMVGIAGGIPKPSKADEHVRLGDIVVSNFMGVIQYDLVKRGASFEEMRNPPRAPSAVLIEAVDALEATELDGNRPWDLYIAQAIAALGWGRPSEDTDELRTPGGRRTIPHPDDVDRKPNLPKVYRGPIASANKLLKDPVLRDALRDQFGVKAVEMEASGVADATWLQERGYFVVRGVCDYCDKSKGDKWQKYASIVAAAYARAILEHLPAASSAAAMTGHAAHPRDGLKLRNLVHELDTRRIFYEIEENFAHAIRSVLEARDEMRHISRGLWHDVEAEGWANELLFFLGDFLSRVGDPTLGIFNYQGFYRQVDNMRASISRVVGLIIRKYQNIRVQNIQLP